MRKTLSFVLLLLLSACATTTAPAPQSVVSDFYEAYVALHPPGLPDGAALERLRPFLSEQLQQLIAAALQQRDAFEKAHPDEKPPFVDGDQFSSLFEGPKSFAIARTDALSDDTWSVHVQFTNDEAHWEDVVVVKKERGRYVIDDVLYSGIGEFNPPGKLSERLSAREE